MRSRNPNLYRQLNDKESLERLSCQRALSGLLWHLRVPAAAMAVVAWRLWKRKGRKGGEEGESKQAGADAVAGGFASAMAAGQAKALGMPGATAAAAPTHAAAPASVPSTSGAQASKSSSKPRRSYIIDRSRKAPGLSQLSGQASASAVQAVAAAAVAAGGVVRVGSDTEGLEDAGLEAQGGELLGMLQSMGFKVMPSQDGSGQVYLVPPSADGDAGYPEDEVANPSGYPAGYPAGYPSGALRNMDPDDPNGGPDMYVPEEEIMEEMMGAMGDDDDYDEGDYEESDDGGEEDYVEFEAHV